MSCDLAVPASLVASKGLTGVVQVLVVDDEPSIVDAVATALRYEGYDVAEARTGRAGLSAAQTGNVDLIVLDVMLPDIDGFEVARRLRADGLATPILFLTAKDALDDKVQGFTVGADDYVTKPFSLAEIVLRVKAILQRTERGAVDTRHTIGVRRRRPRPGHSRGVAERLADRADSDRVQPASLLSAQSAPGSVEAADPRPRLALRLRWRLQHPRDLRELPPQEAQPTRPAADPHGATRRVRAARHGARRVIADEH